MDTFKERGSGLLLPPTDIPMEKGDTSRLTPAQREFLAAFAREMNLKKAIERAGIAQGTYHNWGTDANFRAMFAKVQTQALDAIQVIAGQHAVNAFTRIVDLSEQTEDKRTALNASRDVIRAVKDPGFTGSPDVPSSEGAVWARLFETLMPAIARMGEDERYVNAEVVKPAFPDDDGYMEELAVRSGILADGTEKPNTRTEHNE